MRIASLISNRQYREAVNTVVKAVGVPRFAISKNCRLQVQVGSLFRHRLLTDVLHIKKKNVTDGDNEKCVENCEILR